MSRDEPHFAVVNMSINTMNHIEQYINVGMETTIDVAMDVLEYDKDNVQQTEEVKSVMLQYIQMERDLKDFVASVEHTKRQACESGIVDNLEEVLDARLNEVQENNGEEYLKEHEKFKDLEQKILEMMNPDEVLAPQMSVGTVPEDEEVCMTQETVNTKCPYTGQEMKVPMQNKICKHTYEKGGILEYIKRRGKKAKCPVSSCGNTKPIELSDLEENKELRRYIERKNRQAGKKPKH